MSEKQKQAGTKQIELGEKNFCCLHISLKTTCTKEDEETKENDIKKQNHCKKESSLSKFDPSVLPDNLLDGLWQIARDKNMPKLQSKIEEERFSQLEEEVKDRREIFFD